MSLFLIFIVSVIVTSIWLDNISSRIGVPTLLAFILLGIIFGNNGLVPVGAVDYHFAKETCTLALIFIMFYGGFGTRWQSAKPVVWESSLLASIGVVITAGLIGLFCHFALGWGWLESFLLGSVVSSTDAASVFSILRSRRLGLKNNTAPLLEVESGSNDPMAYMLTATILSLMKGDATGLGLAWLLVSQIVFGALFGVLLGKLAAYLINKIKFHTSGFGSLFVFAAALASYAIPDVIGGNGYLSAYLAGMILGNASFRQKKELVNFFDGITGLMQVFIFFLLGVVAKPDMLHRAVLPALAIFAFITFVGRPLAVSAVLTPFRKYPLKQQTLISFVGLRGAASIVFAIVAITSFPGLENDIFNIVFCIVLFSILLQGSLIPFASRKLDMLDLGNDVMKTFNDYSEEADINFGSVVITDDSPWNGKMVKDLGIPKNLLIALLIRGEENIVPKGETILQAGDKAVLISREFKDSDVSLREKVIEPTDIWPCRKLKECKGMTDGIVILIRRKDENIIPHGDTVIETGDVLVICNMKHMANNKPHSGRLGEP